MTKMNPEPLIKNKYYWASDLYSSRDSFKIGGDYTVYKKEQIKAAVEWFKQYCDSGKNIFRKEYPIKYLLYINKGKKEGWDYKSNESWNNWLLSKAFPDLEDNEK